MTKMSDVGSLQSWQGNSLGFYVEFALLEGLAGVVFGDVGQQQKTSPIWVRGQKKAGGPCIRVVLGKHRTAREGKTNLILQGSCHSGRSGPGKSGRTPQQIRDAAGSGCGPFRRAHTCGAEGDKATRGAFRLSHHVATRILEPDPRDRGGLSHFGLRLAGRHGCPAGCQIPRTL